MANSVWFVNVLKGSDRLFLLRRVLWYAVQSRLCLMRCYTVRLGLGMLAMAASQAPSAAPLGIAVAANFREPMAAIVKAFEQDLGHEVNITVSSSGKLYAQILQGAPFDLFFSADSIKPQRLEKNKRIVPGSRFIYARGALVLWSAAGVYDKNAGDIATLVGGDTEKKIAVANPILAPYGLAAKQSLQYFNAYSSVKKRLVYGENVSQVMGFAVAGGVDWAFLAFSQVRNFPSNHYILVPQNSHAPIVQEAVMLHQGKAASDFVSYMQSPKIAALIQGFGYLPPNPSDNP